VLLIGAMLFAFGWAAAATVRRPWTAWVVPVVLGVLTAFAASLVSDDGPEHGRSLGYLTAAGVAAVAASGVAVGTAVRWWRSRR
jgi:hypothetical protein